MDNSTISGVLDEIARKIHPGGILEAQTSDPREEIIVRYSVGSGSFSGDKKFIVIKTKMYTLNQVEDGHHEGVDEPVFNNIFETLSRPPKPPGPFDEPVGPVDPFNVLSFSKGTWTFADGSSITAVGPANLHVIVYVDGASQLWVSGNQVITNGTGRFAGARGTKTVGGSSWVPKGVPLTASPEFMVRTLEVFRVIRAENIARQ
ncbi:MAG: hypothetical protein ACRD8O_24620 [Bryobacteraceae bacterium]